MGIARPTPLLSPGLWPPSSKGKRPNPSLTGPKQGGKLLTVKPNITSSNRTSHPTRFLHLCSLGIESSIYQSRKSDNISSDISSRKMETPLGVSIPNSRTFCSRSRFLRKKGSGPYHKAYGHPFLRLTRTRNHVTLQPNGTTGHSCAGQQSRSPGCHSCASRNPAFPGIRQNGVTAAKAGIQVPCVSFLRKQQSSISRHSTKRCHCRESGNPGPQCVIPAQAGIQHFQAFDKTVSLPRKRESRSPVCHSCESSSPGPQGVIPARGSSPVLSNVFRLLDSRFRGNDTIEAFSGENHKPSQEKTISLLRRKSKAFSGENQKPSQEKIRGGLHSAKVIRNHKS